MTEFLFHPEAQAEFTEAVRWYQIRSARTASRFEADLERVLKRIRKAPEMFPVYDELYRFALLDRFPYSVVYQVQDLQLYVVAVAHSSRAPNYWRGRV